MEVRLTAERRAAAAALCAKRGDVSPSQLEGAARQMYLSMNAEELLDLIVTGGKKLPDAAAVR